MNSVSSRSELKIAVATSNWRIFKHSCAAIASTDLPVSNLLKGLNVSSLSILITCKYPQLTRRAFYFRNFTFPISFESIHSFNRQRNTPLSNLHGFLVVFTLIQLSLYSSAILHSILPQVKTSLACVTCAALGP